MCQSNLTSQHFILTNHQLLYPLRPVGRRTDLHSKPMILPLSTMRIPPNCHKGPIDSILKTPTAYPSPRVDHNHHLNQQNPSTTTRENELQLVADFERKIAADRLEADLKYAKGRAHEARRWEEEKGTTTRRRDGT